MSTLKYVSTRGQAPVLGFEDVLLTGLAVDGGLYVPESWPSLSADDIQSLSGLGYADIAIRVMTPFIGDTIPEDDFARLVEETYSGFDHPDVAPLCQLGDNEWLMELFHGPTLAFKDYAMQFLGRIFDYVLQRRGEKVTIVGATSGDTGSAAIEACRGKESLEVFILHPEGRVSDVQRRQMTTVQDSNIHNIAIRGNFDDCQNLVKALFNDQSFRNQCRLSAVNSINWARVMAQTVYYFYAASRLDALNTKISFSVPTGNFGNIFAGYAARCMGLPIEQLVIGSNLNDILTRFFETGTMKSGDVHATISPSMDIQISSNFERLLFEMFDRQSGDITKRMETFKNTGAFDVSDERLALAKELFQAARFDDEETKQTIKSIHENHAMLLDPHSAIGVAAGRARRHSGETPLVSLATAHAAKFPDAVEAASGVRPALPESLSDLFEREERFDVIDNDDTALKEYVTTHLGGRD